MAGDTAPVLLLFSDPANYSPTSLIATITIEGDPERFCSGLLSADVHQP